MDISGYIQDLLWEYECVIIPGFGGILAGYRPAEMVLAEHTLYPPSKALAFNEYLNNNDGLLINHICQKANIDYNEATEEVEAWVKKTKQLLANNEEIYLPKIGRFYRDVERNLQFTADANVNYLYSSFGLRKVIAAPVLRDKSDIEVLDAHRASYSLPRTNKTWAMAALVLLFLTIGSIISLMYQGVNIKPLDLNTASVLSMLENVNKPANAIPEPKVSINKEVPDLLANNDNHPQPVVLEATTTIDSTTDQNAAPVKVQTETINTGVSSPTGKRYYVIIGAFHEPENLHRAESFLTEHYPAEQQFEDTNPAMVRIGFYVGDTYRDAFRKLQNARKDDQEYWLLVRR
jgi:hypothetical protein